MRRMRKLGRFLGLLLGGTLAAGNAHADTFVHTDIEYTTNGATKATKIKAAGANFSGKFTCYAIKRN